MVLFKINEVILLSFLQFCRPGASWAESGENSPWLADSGLLGLLAVPPHSLSSFLCVHTERGLGRLCLVLSGHQPSWTGPPPSFNLNLFSVFSAVNLNYVPKALSPNTVTLEARASKSE